MNRREQAMAFGLVALSLALIWSLASRGRTDSTNGKAGSALARPGRSASPADDVPQTLEQQQHAGHSFASAPIHTDDATAEGEPPSPSFKSVPLHVISAPKTAEEVSELVTNLSEGDTAARKDAADRLGMYLQVHPEARTILAMLQNAAVSDPSDIVRERIAMDFLNAKDSRSFDIALDRCENDPSEKVRMYVIESTHIVWDKDYEVFLMPELSGDEAARVVQDRRERVRALLTRLRNSAADQDTISRIDEMLKGR